MFKFLKEKLGQLKIQTAMDIRSGKDDQDSKSGKNNWNSKYEKRKVTFEKALVVNETESDSEQIYSVGEEKAKKYEERIVMKPCLLKCERRVHKNGCLFACGTFRKASVDERNEICKRNFVCILCLRRKGKPHSCHYKKPCNHCKGAHNTLLCKKLLSDQEQALQAEEDEETDIEDESVNHESVFLACEKNRKMKSARQRPIEKSADEKAYKVNESESGDDSEFYEVVGRVMDYSSLDSDSEVDDPVVLMAITEKRKELIRNMESEYGKMDILGSMPKGFGEEYIKNEIKQNLQEAEDDISRANKFDTAKRKFGERGNLWRNILNEASKTEKTVEVVKAETRGFPRLFPGAGEINGKQAKSEEAETNDEEESVALVSDMPDTNFEIKFLKKENEIEFVIPEGSSIHEVLCEEAYRMNKVLPKHKLDSFTQLTGAIPNSGENQKILKDMKYPYKINGDKILIVINSISDTGAGIGMGTPRLMHLPLQELEDGKGVLVGATGRSNSEDTKQRKLLELVGINDKLRIDVRKGCGLGHGRVTPKQVKDSITKQLGLIEYPFQCINQQEEIDLLIGNKEPEGQNVDVLMNKEGWPKPLLSPKLRFYKNKLEGCFIATGIVGLEKEFSYVTNFSGCIKDLLWIGVWNENIAKFFKEYTRCGKNASLQNILKRFLRSFRGDENISYQKVVEWYDINAKDILDIINQNGHAEDAEKTDIGKNWKRKMTEKKNMDSFNLVDQEIKMNDVIQKDTEEVFLTSLEQDVEKVILREDAMEKYLEVTCQDHKDC